MQFGESVIIFIEGAEMHKQLTPNLKKVNNEDDSIKQLNKTKVLSPILYGVTTVKEQTKNINEESDLEEGIQC
ncbi:hypothetical protein CWI38_1587p0010 [Hamiltosporidium tvaerminnensis]|uniref:Uncharacterized protein n=1 Tax=Hamiltosporidium tvaerminnensis TaxID=1176355 RepID=A0A4Q9LQI2_9MICR|nr:hypothetical protein CWI38_1587p0010 [Hamiltosporidium tvaerminnensis]